MSRRLPLSARLDPLGMSIVLRVDQIRADTLDALARAWLEDPTAVTDALDQLAATLGRSTHPDDDTGMHPAAIDAARDELESLTDMGDAEIRLSYDQALRLAAELGTAASGTFTARTRAAAA